MGRDDDEGNPIDIDQYQLPHILDVSCTYLPIHDFIPRKSISASPFIGPVRNIGGGVEVGEINPWYGGTGIGDDILRNDRDDKEELREEEAARKAELEADLAEIERLEQEQREEEERLEREAELEAQRDANEKAGFGRITDEERRFNEAMDDSDIDWEEEDDVEWDIGEQGPMNYDQDGSGNPPPTPPMI